MWLTEGGYCPNLEDFRCEYRNTKIFAVLCELGKILGDIMENPLYWRKWLLFFILLRQVHGRKLLLFLLIYYFLSFLKLTSSVSCWWWPMLPLLGRWFAGWCTWEKWNCRLMKNYRTRVVWSKKFMTNTEHMHFPFMCIFYYRNSVQHSTKLKASKPLHLLLHYIMRSLAATVNTFLFLFMYTLFVEWQ